VSKVNKISIRINAEAYKAYVKACDGKSGWHKTEIASKALIYGTEVMEAMERYEEQVKIAAQKEVLNRLKSQEEPTTQG